MRLQQRPEPRTTHEIMRGVLMWLLAAASGAAVVDGIHTPVNNKYRVFHPAFPTFLTRPVPAEEVKQLSNVRDAMRQAAGDNPSADFSCLPWKVFPALGISDRSGNVWSKSQIEEAYEKNKHNGYFVWYVVWSGGRAVGSGGWCG